MTSAEEINASGGSVENGSGTAAAISEKLTIPTPRPPNSIKGTDSAPSAIESSNKVLHSMLQPTVDISTRAGTSVKDVILSILAPTLYWKGEDDGRKRAPSEQEVVLRVEIAKSTEVKLMTWFSLIFSVFAFIASVSALFILDLYQSS